HSVFSGGGRIAFNLGYTDYKAFQEDKKAAEWIKGNKKSIAPPIHQNDILTYMEALYKNNLTPRFANFLNGYEDFRNAQKEYKNGNLSDAEWLSAQQKFMSANPNYMKLVNETRRSAHDTPVMQPKFNQQAAIGSLNKMIKAGGYAPYVGHDVEVENDFAEEVANDISKLKYSAKDSDNVNPTESDDIRYSIKELQDGTKYVKLDGNLFVDENGNQLTQLEAYNRLVGKTITTVDGDHILLVKKLANKNIYNEFIKQRPNYDGLTRNQVISISDSINKNIVETIENSLLIKNAPDSFQRHKNLNIVEFDTRKVLIADDSGAYDLELSIAILTDGTEVGYCKRLLTANDNVWKKIKMEESMSTSQFSQPSVGNDTTLSKESQEDNQKLSRKDSDIWSNNFDKWLDALDIEDLLLDDITSTNETKKKRAARRIDEVNEKLKEIGLSFNGTKVAAWTDERIERHLNSFAAEIPNYAQAYIAYITPLQFLKLTTGDNPRTVDRINEESSKYGELEFDKLGDRLPMFLHIEEGKTSARVIGHEGRHRMKLLGDAGFEKIPVLLLNYDNKYSKVTLNNLKLKPQSFNDDGFISKSRDVIIEEAIPFSRANKEEIIKKFGSGNKSADVMYSRKDNFKLSPREQLLQEQVEFWKQEATKEVTVITKAAAMEIAKDVMSDYHGKLSREEVAQRITKIREDLLHGTRAQFEQGEEAALQLASDLAKDMYAIEKSDVTQEGIDIRAHIKGGRFYIPKDFRGDFTQKYESFEKFRVKNMSRFKLTIDETATPIDVFWDELRELYPNYFPSDITHPADQAMYIDELLDDLKASTEFVPLTESEAELVDYIKAEIMQRAAIADYYSTRKLQWKIKFDELKAKQREKVDQMRKEKRDAIEELKQHNREIKQNARERKYDSNLRHELLRFARRLKNIKTTQANKALIKELIGNLDTFTFSLTEGTRDNLEQLRTWIEERKQNDEYFTPLDSTVKLINRLDSKFIADMTVEQMEELVEALKNIEYTIRNEKRMLAVNEAVNVAEQAHTSYGNIINAKNVLGNNGFVNEMVNGVQSPLRVISMFTGYEANDPLYKAATRLNEGAHQEMDYKMKAEDMFRTWTTDKAYTDSITGKKAQTIMIGGGMMTRADIMSLMLTIKQAQGYQHIMNGGIMIPVEYKNGKASEETVLFRPTKDEIKWLENHLTTQDKAFMEMATRYFNEVSRNAINEVAEMLHGVSLARVDNYFPIHVSRDFIKTESENIKRDGTIEGMGYLKERINSSKPIYLNNLVDELNRSIRMHARYVGLAIPVRDFHLLFNYSNNEEGLSVMHALENKFGKRASEYINKLESDVSGGTFRESSWWESLLNKARSGYAGATLTLNAWVALTQLASYPTAAAVIGYEPLVKALTSNREISEKLIRNYTPLYAYRARGYSTIELGDIASQNKNLPKALNWIQTMDLATTKRLWLASEFFVEENFKDVPRMSDEFYKKVAEVYNRVIEETQPNYTVMQRGSMLRDQSSVMKALLMFRTQTFQNQSLVYDAALQYKVMSDKLKNDPNNTTAKVNLNSAKRKLSRVITSQLVQTLMVIALRFGRNALRKDDEWYENLIPTMTQSLTGGFPIVGDLISSAVSYWVKGGNFYGLNISSVDAINDLSEALTKLPYKLIKGSSPDVVVDGIEDIAASIAMMFGIPVNNITRDLKAILEKLGVEKTIINLIP
ncbi:MAG: hypothetical protein MJ236_02260, partial [Clostridia bacterium]|nr:hypothetical protein [Clostridia bacterium]